MALDGLNVKGTAEMVEEIKANANAVTEAEAAKEKEGQEEDLHSALAGHIKKVFRINRDARRNSLVEAGMTEDSLDYNGEYDSKDLARIKKIELGSTIFMNLPATKARALASWIKDVYFNATEKTWSFDHSPVQELPEEIRLQIENQVATEFQEYVQEQAKKKAEEKQAKQKQQLGS